MPVKMPDLPKHESQMPLSVGRTKVEVPDISKAYDKVDRTVNKIGDQLVQYQDKVEQDAADTEATKRASEYEVSFRKRLYGDGEQTGVKYQEGDPTPVYQQFDAAMDEDFKRLTDVGDLSPRARDLVTKRVTDRANQLQLTRLSEQGAQSAQYENNVHNADIDLKKQGMPEATAYIQPGDESSFAPFDDLYGGIRNSHIRKSLKLNLARPDDAGDTLYVDPDTGQSMRVSMAPQAKREMNKDLSEGTANAMQVLIKSGHPDKAQALMDRYGNSIDAYKKAQLADDFQKETIDQKGTLLSIHPDKEKEILKGVDEVQATKIKDKARSLANTRQAEVEQAQNRVDKRNSEALGSMVLNRQRSETPYVSVEAAMQDPKFSAMIDKIKDPVKKQAVYDSIEQPKNSTSEAQDRVQSLVLGDDPNRDVRKMSHSEINQQLMGLDKHDRTYWENLINKMKTETGDEQKQKFATGGKLLKEELLRLNVLTEDDFNRVSGKQFDLYQGLRNQLVDELDRRGPMTASEVEKTVRNFAAAASQKKSFVAEEPNKFQGKVNQAPGTKVAVNRPFYELGNGEPPPTKTVAPAESSKPKVQKKRSEWNRDYLKEYGAPATDQQLNAYIQKNGG